MARNHYSYEKRQQELKKKKKRAEKLARKQNKDSQEEPVEIKYDQFGLPIEPEVVEIEETAQEGDETETTDNAQE